MENKKNKPLGGGVHQLNNICNYLPFDLQLFALEYNKVDNPYEYILDKNTYAKGENIANVKDITIETVSDSKIYDGKPLSYDNFNIISGELNDGDILVCDTTKPVSSITNAGSISNVLTPKIIDSTTGEDHTANYNITINYGTLTVNKRPVTLKSVNGDWNYDSITRSCPEVRVSGYGFVDNDVISVEATGKFKDPGTYENKPIVITWADGADPNNYDITYDYGTITISKPTAPPIDIGAAMSGQHDNTSDKGIEGKDTGGVYGGDEF